MMVSEFIRRGAFWALDVMRGRRVLKHYKSIQYFFNHPEEVVSYQKKQFAMLADFAVKNTNYYNSVCGGGIQKLKISL